MLDRIGEVAYLSTLLDTVTTPESAAYYAKIVAEKSRLRGRIGVGIEVTRLGYDCESDADDALTRAEEEPVLEPAHVETLEQTMGALRNGSCEPHGLRGKRSHAVPRRRARDR